MKTCKTCDYWHARPCGITSIGACWNAGDVWSNLVFDGRLITGENFGCRFWKLRTSTEEERMKRVETLLKEPEQ